MKKRLCSMICLAGIISIMLCSCRNQGISAELPDSEAEEAENGRNHAECKEVDTKRIPMKEVAKGIVVDAMEPLCTERTARMGQNFSSD